MINYIKIQTLTPVHIGSGNMLQGNSEYLNFSSEKKIALIEARKVLDIIGAENIDKWLSVIDNQENLLDYLEQRKPTIKSKDVAERIINIEGTNPTPKNDRYPDVKEQLFAGNQKPLLPGTSIKGAIRTAILTSKIYNDSSSPKFASQPSKISETSFNKTKYKDSQLNKRFLGRNANEDILRLLQVTDVHFDETVCLLSQTLNLIGGKYKIDTRFNQFIEAIPEGSLALGRIKILNTQEHEKLTDWYKKTFAKEKELNNFNVKNIFKIINEHTKKLVTKEIEYWNKQEIIDNVADFTETLTSIISQIEKIEINKENACILRIGFGSGFKSMTGDWQIDLLNPTDYRNLIDSKQVRGSNYSGLDFPKSRKIIEGGQPLGFVKITTITEEEIGSISQEQIKLKQVKIKLQEEKLQIEIALEQEVILQRKLEEEEKLKQLEENWKNEPQPFEKELYNGAELEAKLYKAENGYATILYSPQLGTLSNPFAMEINKNQKKDENYQQSSLVKVICQITKSGRTSFIFKHFINR
jgi:CRISPR type III-A-associated RAMP protein Csm5